MLSLLHFMADYKCHLETTGLHISYTLLLTEHLPENWSSQKGRSRSARLICYLIHWHDDSLFFESCYWELSIGYQLISPPVSNYLISS